MITRAERIFLHSNRRIIFCYAILITILSSVLIWQFINYERRIKNNLNISGNLLFKRTDNDLVSSRANIFSSKFEHLLRSVSIVNNIFQSVADRRKELSPINSLLRQKDLFNRAFTYRKKANVLFSTNDEFGQLVLWSRAFQIKKGQKDSLEFNFDKNILVHQSSLDLATPIFIKMVTHGNLGYNQVFCDGPPNFPYTFRYPMNSFEKELFYPGFTATSIWEFYVPIFHPVFKQRIQDGRLNINEDLVLTPIYSDAYTAKPTLSIIAAFLNKKTQEFEGRYSIDIFLDQLNQLYFNELTNGFFPAVLFDQSKSILNYSKDLVSFLKIDEQDNVIYPGILNRIVVSPNLEESKNKSLRKLDCSQTDSSFKVGGKDYIFICNEIDVGMNFDYLTSKDLKKSNFYLGYFIPQSNKEFGTFSFKSTGKIFAVKAICFSLIILLIVILVTLSFKLLFSFQNFVFEKLGHRLADSESSFWFPVHFTLVFEVDEKLNKINSVQKNILNSRREKQNEIVKLEEQIQSLYQKIYNNLNKIQQNDLILEGKKQGSTNTVSIIYDSYNRFQADIDDLFTLICASSLNISLAQLNLFYFLENYFNYLKEDYDFVLENEIQEDTIVNTNNENFRYILDSLIQIILAFFEISSLRVCSSEKRGFKYLTFEFKQLRLINPLEAYFEFIGVLHQTLLKCQSFSKSKEKLLDKIQIEKIKGDVVESELNNGTIKIEIEFKNQNLLATQIYEKRKIFKLKNEYIDETLQKIFTSGLAQKHDIFVIQDGINVGNDKLSQERDFSPRSLNLIAKHASIEGRKVYLIYNAISNFENTLSVLDTLQTFFVETKTGNILINVPITNLSKIPQTLKLAPLISSSADKNDKQISFINNLILSNLNKSQLELISEINNLEPSVEKFEDNSRKAFDIIKDFVHGDIFKGEEYYFLNNHKTDQYYDFVSCNGKFTCIICLVSVPFNIVIKRDSPFSRMEEVFLKCLALQFNAFQNKVLILNSNESVLRAFQYFLKNLKRFVYARKAGENKIEIFVSENSKLTKELLLIPFDVIRHYLSDSMIEDKGGYLINMELIRGHKKDISDLDLLDTLTEKKRVNR